METTITITLILLSTVGARNVPANMAEPSEVMYPVIAENSHTTTAVDGKVFPEDLIEDAVHAADPEQTLNEDIHFVEDTTGIDENQKWYSMPAESYNVDGVNKDRKTVYIFEDRAVLDIKECPRCKIRVGDECKPLMKKCK